MSSSLLSNCWLIRLHELDFSFLEIRNSLVIVSGVKRRLLGRSNEGIDWSLLDRELVGWLGSESVDLAGWLRSKCSGLLSWLSKGGCWLTEGSSRLSKGLRLSESCLLRRRLQHDQWCE